MAVRREKITVLSRLRDVLEEHPELIGVTTRFGIAFGFGDKSVGDVCGRDGVDCGSFLAVCNYLIGSDFRDETISLPSLMGYLKKAHVYFLDYLLPAIRRKLIDAINRSPVDDVAFLLLKFYDEYVEEVRTHMHHENDEVFKYVGALMNGEINQKFRITDYSHGHGSMAEKLSQIKNIFIMHYRVKDNEVLTSGLMDIIECGKELERHCSIENDIFVPAVEDLEHSLKLKSLKEYAEKKEDYADSAKEKMTEREKEIIRCVARGMSNKEIASELCLSIHTVTTYRRNISSKLNIHSSAGLTVYAILEGLVDLQSISL